MSSHTWHILLASFVLMTPLILNDNSAASASPQKIAESEIVIRLSELLATDELGQTNDFTVNEKPISLKGASSQFHFYLPIAQRVRLKKISFHMDFIHSSALIQKRSLLMMSVNGMTISQIQLDPQSPHVIADIPLPEEYLKQGFNKITFSIAQHYTDECENPRAPELWTQINTAKSYFNCLYVYQTTEYTLSELKHVFDEKLFDYKLTLMRPKAVSDYEDKDLAWGSLAVQGVAVRLGEKPFDIDIQEALPVRKNSITVQKNSTVFSFLDQTGIESDICLIGTINELEKFITPSHRTKIRDSVSGPYLALFPGKDRSKRILVLSGTTASEVSIAAKAFTFEGFPYPDSSSMVVNDLYLPNYSHSNAAKELQPGVRYSFKDLGFNTISRGASKRLELLFKIPPDILINEKTTATLRMHFAYGAALREDSVLNIYLNSHFEKAVYLDDKYGKRHTDYEFTIPLQSFRAGINRLRFEPVMPPRVSGNCSLTQTDNATLTIFENSSIELPILDHYVRLPDLRIFNRTGFPYTQKATGEAMGILVRGKEKGTITSAWQIVAKIAQKTSMPLYRSSISFRHIGQRHLLIVGSKKSLSDRDFMGSPVRLTPTMSFEFPLQQQPAFQDTSLFESFKTILSPTTSLAFPMLKTGYSKIHFKSYFGGDTLLWCFESASEPGRLVSVVTSETADSLSKGIRRLVEADFWNTLQGNQAIWNEDDIAPRTQENRVEFFLGETSLGNSLAYYYSKHTITLLVAILALTVALSCLGHRWLNRYKEKQNKGTNDLEI